MGATIPVSSLAHPIPRTFSLPFSYSCMREGEGTKEKKRERKERKK
jgi:hypothetical protein